jgi:hypothetical protein
MNFTNTDCVGKEMSDEVFYQVEEEISPFYANVWEQVYWQTESQVYDQINLIENKLHQEIKK